MACCSLGYIKEECPYKGEDCPLGACTIPNIDEDINTGISDSQESGEKVVVRAGDFFT